MVCVGLHEAYPSISCMNYPIIFDTGGNTSRITQGLSYLEQEIKVLACNI